MEKNLTTPPPIPPPLHRGERITFHAKVGNSNTWWPFIAITLFGIIFIWLAQPPIYLGVLITLSCITFFGVFFILSKTMYDDISYTLENKTLLISHPMRSLAIDIGTIKKVRRGDFLIDRGSHNFSASYPNIRILYEKNKYVYISPADEQGFLMTLQKINPNITFSKELHIG